MARGVNKVILIGNLGKDPEVRYTTGGTAVASFSIATSERFKNKSGEWEDRTEWVTVVAFGKTAENCREFLQKGRQIYVDGRLQTRSWEDKEGNKRYTTEIRADNMVMLGSKGEGGGGGGGAEHGGPSSASPSGPPGGEITDDDIPF